MGYIPGDYWLRCDRCGFNIRRSKARKTWDGLWCCNKCWEPKHPQRNVRAKRDKISVPVARPDNALIFRETTLSSAASKGDTSIAVADATYIDEYDAIGIVTDDTSGEPTTTGTDSVTSVGAMVHWTHVASKSGTTLTLAEAMPYDATSGNTVYTRGIDLLTWSQIETSDL